MDRKNNGELMEMLSLKKTLYEMAEANEVHVVRKDNDNILKRALMREVSGHRKVGRPKQTWRREVEENGLKCFVFPSLNV